MSKRFFDHDPTTGMTSYYEGFDGKDGGGFRIYTEGETDAYIEENRKKRSMGRDYYAADPDMWKVASVPYIILLKWAEELGIPASDVFGDKMAEVVARRVNDSDYREFKTAEVRI